MKALKITTRETDKLRDRVKVLATSIEHTEKYSTSGSYAARDIDKTKALMADVSATLCALIDSKTSAINAALDKVNGKAVSHTINTYAGVAMIADRAEKLLDARGVTQKGRVGTTVIHTPSGPGASSYKYAAVSTTIYLKRVADGWRLTGVERSSVWPKSSETFSLTVSGGAGADIFRAAFDGIVIRSAEEATA